MNNPEAYHPEEAEYNPETSQEEGREERAERTLRFLKKIHADEVFSDEEHTREYIDNIEYDDFKELLDGVNAVIRGIPVARRAADGERVVITSGLIDKGYIPPKYNERDELLREVFHTAKRMNQKQAPLADIAILLGVSINAIHFYGDGNGRTSRLAYTLINDGYSEEKIEGVLGNEGRKTAWTSTEYFDVPINQALYQKSTSLNPLDPASPRAFWTQSGLASSAALSEMLSTRQDISDKDKEFLTMVICSDEARSLGHGFLAVVDFLSSRGKLHDYIKSFESDGRVVRSNLLIDKVIPNLTTEDITEIRENYWRIKKQYVEAIIDSIENPNDYLITDRDGNTSTVLDEFKKEQTQLTSQ